jgi:hypothetical protein
MNRKTVLGITYLVMATVLSCNIQKANPASDFEAKNIDGDKAIEISGYVGVLQNVNIPSKIRRLPVTSIGDSAFFQKNLTSVIIPNSVTKIGEGVFCNDHNENTNITSITIGGNVSLAVPNSFTDGSFGADFETFYNASGRQAGTYTRPDTHSETWTKSGSTRQSRPVKTAFTGTWSGTIEGESIKLVIEGSTWTIKSLADDEYGSFTATYNGNTATINMWGETSTATVSKNSLTWTIDGDSFTLTKK